MDMIHDLYSGLESDSISSTLHHNKNFMGCIQGHKGPFHHKEEVAIHAFNARVPLSTTNFFLQVPNGSIMKMSTFIFVDQVEPGFSTRERKYVNLYLLFLSNVDLVLNQQSPRVNAQI
jgi:hypothetical protein